MWQFYGDWRVANDSYATMAAYVDFLGRYGVAQGLVTFGMYGDWEAPAATPRPQVSGFFHALSVAYLADMAHALGRDADWQRYTALAQQLRAAYHRVYFNATQQAYVSNTQTANALPIYLGCVPPDDMPAVSAALVRSVLATGVRITSGAVGSRYLLYALASVGRMDLAMQLMLRTDSPSWAYMVQQGPGTIWESWSGTAYESDGSKNHPMNAGGIGAFLYEHVAGIESRMGGRQNVLRVHAAVADALGAANTTLRTLHGALHFAWQRSADRAALDVQVRTPPSSVTELHLAADAVAGDRLLLIELPSGAAIRTWDSAERTALRAGLADVRWIRAYGGSRCLAVRLVGGGSYALRLQAA